MTARVGRRDHAQAPLPASPWRAYLRHLAKWMLIAIAAALGASLGLLVRVAL